MKTEKIKNKYIKAVARKIKCNKKIKQHFLDSLSNSIEDVLSENSSVTFEEFKNILGEPIEVAKEFENTLDSEILRKHKIKKLVIIIGIVVFVLALFVGFYCYLVYGAIEPTYIYETPTNELL